MDEVDEAKVEIAVIKNDVKYIKDSIDDLNAKIEGLDFKKSFEKQGSRIGSLENELAVITSKVKMAQWLICLIGSTAIAALTTAIMKGVIH